ncbi:uncharacterized protein LOC108049761 isoform X1 [Drosophila rhopaloa]|uniref:F-box domain-containing protein n=2 Tax=Drosophila rhopaloa TaxID=1041015 RepID=A0ABM5HWV2_DRORH|nr:uncharacterized protein LOC108049761 isoform X1 [Drosophila rhopaloa]
MSLSSLPDKCLKIVFQHLDMRSQCNWAFTCSRFLRIYRMVNKNKFRNFIWYERSCEWSKLEVEYLFRLNGRHMRRLAISDAQDLSSHSDLMLWSKSIFVAPVCVYLKNLRSLTLCLSDNMGEIMLKVCRYMLKLEDLTVNTNCEMNYTFLVLLPRLKSLDLENFDVGGADTLFELLATMRRDVLQSLRIGSQLQLKEAKDIIKLKSLEMLSVCNPSRVFLELILQLDTVRVLSISQGISLDDVDFMRFMAESKALSALYVSDCPNLTWEFPVFAVDLLKHEKHTLLCRHRRLPFYVECCRTGITMKALKKSDIFSSQELLEVKLVDKDRKVKMLI